MSSPTNEAASAPLILYAEDDDVQASAVKDLLAAAGWRVKRVANGVYAVAHLRLAEHYDLVILNKELRGLDGLEVIKDARQQKHRKETPIILLSLEDCARKAHEAGVDAFLQKPQSIFSLVETARRLLAPAHGVKVKRQK